MPPEVRGGPRGIALAMTECQVVSVAGYTDRVEISANERGERVVTLTYLSGDRPGIYRFRSGRLVNMERIAEAPQPKKPQRAAKQAKAKQRPMSGPGDPDFAARRLAARARLDAMDDAGAADPYRRAWFAAVYETAGDDAAQIPWADLAPHPLLAALA